MNHVEAEAWHRLGDVLLGIDRRVAAFRAFRRALWLDQQRPQTYRALGRLLFDCGQLEPALHCFEQASRCEAVCTGMP